MLDVHAPEHGIHGTRDFFVHLLSITAGLLIALTLEAGVEAIHHRHQKLEADANLRQELRDNSRDLKKVMASIPKERKAVSELLKLAQDRAQGKTVAAPSQQLGFNFATLHQASWGTASATGVLNYMDYAQVQRFAEAYEMQQQFVALQQATLKDYLEAHSHMSLDALVFDVQGMTPQDAAATVVDLRHTLVQLVAMQEIGKALGLDYDRAVDGH